MAVKVELADLQHDREIILDALSRFLISSSDRERFEWLYEQNPHGKTSAWFAVETANNSIIGSAAAFQRCFYYKGNEVKGWVLGDFCLDPGYRSLGPALQLQRACMRTLETEKETFFYDFPSVSMMAVYKTLGLRMQGNMLRLVKPLRVDRKVTQMIGNPMAQRVVASLGNRLLKIASPREDIDKSLVVCVRPQFCDEEFTVLAKEQRGKFGVCLERSAEYLNWRYLRNPVARHEVITARRDGRLVGYLVWRDDGEDASIVDLFGEENSSMVRSLVGVTAALVQNSGMMTLSVSINECHPWRPVFSEMGFHLRDYAPVVIITSEPFLKKITPQLNDWYLMQGDRES